MVVSASITGKDLSSSSVSVSVSFSGSISKPSAGTMGTSAGSGTSVVKTVTQTVGATYSYDQSSIGGKFAYVGGSAMLGANLDGAQLRATITVTGQDGTKTVTGSSDALLVINVKSWTSASLSVCVMDIDIGGPTVVSSLMDYIGLIEEQKIAKAW
jgi:hypothetical protein